jgi:hypothetical protein
MKSKMDPDQILKEAFEHYEEDWLDFKLKLNFKDPEDKGELIKDISALANQVDPSGYLIIGVNFIPGQPLHKKGITDYYDDNEFQQFMPGKLDPDVSFSYQEHNYEDGKCYGIFTVPYSDAKPHQVNVDIGKVRKGQYFIRQGSRTRTAATKEISEMLLNTTNDISKISIEELGKRILLMIRGGDHVGIRELLRNAPQPPKRILNENPNNDEIAKKASELITSLSDRVLAIGLAVISHQSVACYNDLLKCMANLYVTSNQESSLKQLCGGRTWGKILLFGAYGALLRNWTFLFDLFQHKIVKKTGNKFSLVTNPFDNAEFEDSDSVFGKIYLDCDVPKGFDCENMDFQIALMEYDFLAHFYCFSSRPQKSYKPNWPDNTIAVDHLIEEIGRDESIAKLFGFTLEKYASRLEFGNQLNNLRKRY